MMRQTLDAPSVPVAGLEWAHPLVQRWFVGRFGTPTEPQLRGWPAIVAGRSTLISAPTGSGKTLSAFLACLDRLVRQALDGSLADRTEVVYVSPLKALSNDIHQNLERPLAEIAALAESEGVTLPEIRAAVRTGDTLGPARRSMLQRPPHILVTTPESLYILLTAARSREILRDVRTVIVDEIHAVADDKRGSHLALTLERLEALSRHRLVRIGLSATQRPIATVARFLVGRRRLPQIVEVPARREIDVAVEVPRSELGAVAPNEVWDEIYDRIAALAGQHRSTLVFVNTRRLSERVTMHLASRLGADAVAAHHGSLSRRIRLDAERRLKAGALRVLVATASLELGIDVGSVDLVCQIGSPRSIGVALQRVGRSGHWRGAIPKGRFFATTLDELIECAALVQAIRTGALDVLRVPPAPLDVLAQQIVAMCAAEDWQEDALFDTVRLADPYRRLPRATFDEIVEMLSSGIAARRGRLAAFLHRDQVHATLRARRGARLTAITNGGAIPDTGLYTVVAQPDGTIVGSVDEDFAVESMAGDVMLLGNTSWRIRRVTSAGRVLVEDAHGQAPTIPFWRGEAPGRTDELSERVSLVRREIDERSRGAAPGSAGQAPACRPAVDWLMDTCGLDRAGAEQAVEFVVAGRTVLGAVPTRETIVAERFFDEGGGMQLVIHAPFGARVNRAWGLALRKRFCRTFNFELQAAATDNGINIALAEQHSFPLADVFGYLKPASARAVLEQAALASPIFGTRWRWAASRALALPRFRHGGKVPIQIQRLLSDDLLAAVFPDVAACQENIEGDIRIPDHPLVREVMSDVLTEAMDLDGLIDVLTRIRSGAVQVVAIDTPVPSVFSHEILNANPYAFLDDAPLEERRARAVSLRRVLPDSVLAEAGRLDPAAIAEVRDQAWPDARDVDEVHDALLTLVALPLDLDAAEGRGSSPLAGRVRRAAADWAGWLDALRADRRVTRARAGGRQYWVPTERRAIFSGIFPAAVFEDPMPALGTTTSPDSPPAEHLVQGWLTHAGPTSAPELADLLGLDAETIETALLRLEASGWALRGRFTDETDAVEWCERRLLARIHRLTLGMLRREIEPVSPAQFLGWLFDWQHVAPGTQQHGERGLAAVLEQLQGFEAPASAWERDILPRRVSGYAPADLDRLCMSGIVGWGRVSPHRATLDAPSGTTSSSTGDGVGRDGRAGRGARRRIVPTSAAPLTFFVREQAGWMGTHTRTSRDEMPPVLSANARDVFTCLKDGGALFFPDIQRRTRLVTAELEAALWELVAAGLVTADGFDAMRALVDPRRRSGRGSHRRPGVSGGRWSVLSAVDPGADRADVADAAAWMLLRRYGVVFRELLARESNVPPWREVLVRLRRLEDRGEIRGGRFVDGFVGEQFALPAAVESLRAQRHRAPSAVPITLSAADPLNLAGIIVPGDRVPAISGRSVTYQGGAAAAAAVPA